MVFISKKTFYIYVLNKMNISDGFLGGICNANTSSGCFDRNADCIDSICQCSKDFTDINGTCTAGKMLTLYNTILETGNSCYYYFNILCCIDLSIKVECGIS